MQTCDLKDIVGEVVSAYDANDEIFFNKPNHHMPNRSEIINILKDIRNLIFPGYFEDAELAASDASYMVGSTLLRVEHALNIQVREALMFRDADKLPQEAIDARASEITSSFLCKIPSIQRMMYMDIQAAYEGDPAAQSREEIIFSYPGFFAIWVYRVAHELYVQDVPLIPRIMTEYAHSRTGVDINAGAEIGEYFFIDHATGVVIGETTRIGDHVKIYQGVTLGALSTRGGQRLAGVRRHPTIEDNVTIYSNASILGGETIIGEGSIIAGSAFVTESVPAGSRVTVANQEVKIR